MIQSEKLIGNSATLLKKANNVRLDNNGLKIQWAAKDASIAFYTCVCNPHV